MNKAASGCLLKKRGAVGGHVILLEILMGKAKSCLMDKECYYSHHDEAN